VLIFVSSVPSQEIGWDERLQNDRFCVVWDLKPCLNQYCGVQNQQLTTAAQLRSRDNDIPDSSEHHHNTSPLDEVQYSLLMMTFYDSLLSNIIIVMWCLPSASLPSFYSFITGPPTHSVGGSIVLLVGVCRRLSASVTLHGGPAGGFTRAGQAMTSCRLQSIYSSTTARRASSVTSR